MAVREYAPSKHVGQVGQEVELKGFVNYIGPALEDNPKYPAKPGQGARHRYMFGIDGDTVVGFSGALNRVQKGDRIRFSAKIKDHAEWNGQNQTVVSHIRLLENISAVQNR